MMKNFFFLFWILVVEVGGCIKRESKRSVTDLPPIPLIPFIYLVAHIGSVPATGAATWKIDAPLPRPSMDSGHFGPSVFSPISAGPEPLLGFGGGRKSPSNFSGPSQKGCLSLETSMPV